MTQQTFDLIGGHPVLDFVNTVSTWTGPVDERREYLGSPEDATRLGRLIGLLPSGDSVPAAELDELRRLRSTLEPIFRALALRKPLPAAELDELSRGAAQAAGAARLRPAAGRVVRAIDHRGAGRALLRYRLIDAAVALLTSVTSSRVRSCPACGWLFVDSSKNGSRRWCSMSTCGSSAKSKAYYRRRRRRG
jgi:predicted RNA-binding Zn ribbon-like protein